MQGKMRRVEADNPSPADMIGALRRTPGNGDRAGGENSKTLLREPTFAEVSGLTFEPLRVIRVFQQQEHNDFARLLNRGSSLE